MKYQDDKFESWPMPIEIQKKRPVFFVKFFMQPDNFFRRPFQKIFPKMSVLFDEQNVSYKAKL